MTIVEVSSDLCRSFALVRCSSPSWWKLATRSHRASPSPARPLLSPSLSVAGPAQCVLTLISPFHTHRHEHGWPSCAMVKPSCWSSPAGELAPRKRARGICFECACAYYLAGRLALRYELTCPLAILVVVAGARPTPSCLGPSTNSLVRLRARCRPTRRKCPLVAVEQANLSSLIQ